MSSMYWYVMIVMVIHVQYVLVCDDSYGHSCPVCTGM